MRLNFFIASLLVTRLACAGDFLDLSIPDMTQNQAVAAWTDKTYNIDDVCEVLDHYDFPDKIEFYGKEPEDPMANYTNTFLKVFINDKIPISDQPRTWRGLMTAISCEGHNMAAQTNPYLGRHFLVHLANALRHSRLYNAYGHVITMHASSNEKGYAWYISEPLIELSAFITEFLLRNPTTSREERSFESTHRHHSDVFS